MSSRATWGIAFVLAGCGGAIDVSDGGSDSGTDGPVQIDAGIDAILDAPSDALDGATKDGATKDGGPIIDGGSCAPGPLGSFSPTYVPPLRTVGACAGSDFSDFYAWCIDPGNMNACKGFTQSKPGCMKCLVTVETAAKLGPLVQTGSGLSWINTAGCVALVEGSSICATKIAALEECKRTVCELSCPVFDAQSFAAYTQCLATAEASTCSAYAAPAQCASPAATAACLTPPTFAAKYTSMAPIFCGP